MADIGVILVPLQGGEADRQTLQSALTLAACSGARIDAVVAGIDLEPIAMLPGTDGLYPFDPLLPALGDAERERRRSIESAFAEWRAAHSTIIDAQGIELRLFSADDCGGEPVRERALLSDLVVVSTVGGHPAAAETIIQTVLFDCGRPLLATAGTPPAATDAPVLIAWNGSAECARATTAALPLLRSASRVTVAHAHDQPMPSEDPARVLDYLRQHGVKAQATILPGDGGTGRALLKAAAELGAGLLVSGAYGHSRARRLIFGGTTQYLLQHADIPLLLAH